MTDPTPASEFSKLLDLALAEAQAGTRVLVERHRLETFANYRLDPQRGTLTIGDSPTFDVQFVGGFDPKTNLWRWAWADLEMPKTFGVAAAQANAFGKANGIPELIAATVPADEATCWKWTAFAAGLAKWPAIYRAPLDTGATVFVAFRVRESISASSITIGSPDS